MDIYKRLNISDYIFTKSLLYAKANLDDQEFQLFERIFNMFFNDLPEPELFIYVHSTADRLVQNIQKRGRGFEQVVRKSYLQSVEDIYFDYFKKNNHLRILIIPSDDLDFVENKSHYSKIKEAVTKEYEPGIHYLDIK